MSDLGGTDTNPLKLPKVQSSRLTDRTLHARSVTRAPGSAKPLTLPLVYRFAQSLRVESTDSTLRALSVTCTGTRMERAAPWG